MVKTTIKYEKVDSNNIRKWTKEDELINKQDLQELKTNYNLIVNMSDTILEKLYMREDGTIQEGIADSIKARFQELVNEIDILLDLFNNSTTQESIDIINE